LALEPFLESLKASSTAAACRAFQKKPGTTPGEFATDRSLVGK